MRFNDGSLQPVTSQQGASFFLAGDGCRGYGLTFFGIQGLTGPGLVNTYPGRSSMMFYFQQYACYGKQYKCQVKIYMLCPA